MHSFDGVGYSRLVDLLVPFQLPSFVWLSSLLWLLAGCATTSAWEREYLARPEMSLDDDADEASLRQHYLGTREGAVGGSGGGGGGCGCN